MAVTREIALRQMNEFKETRPAKLPLSYPNATRLVDRLLARMRGAIKPGSRGEKINRLKVLFGRGPQKQASWFCDPCKVEVYERRCPHCGKTKRERT